MGQFRQGNRHSGFGLRSGQNKFGARSRGFDRDRKFGRTDRGPQMHEATCSECGKQCEVPFRPTGTKPVLCRECFRNDKPSTTRSFNDSPRDFSPRTSPSHSERSDQLDHINAKLDKIMKILEGLELINDDDDSEEKNK